MSRIEILDAATSNAIAAGEVIERPMSIEIGRAHV